MKLCSLVDEHQYSTSVLQVDKMPTFMYVCDFIYIYIYVCVCVCVCVYKNCTFLYQSGLAVYHKPCVVRTLKNVRF